MHGLFLWKTKNVLQLLMLLKKNKQTKKQKKDAACKPNKIWVDEYSEFYNRSMIKWSQDNDMKTYSTHN